MEKHDESQDAKAARLVRQQAALDAAIALFPTLKALSVVLGLENYQTLQKWRDTEVPIEWAADVETAAGGKVPKRALREDWDWFVLGRLRTQRRRRA
jgi:DNA-binding transcriptional regulator YdaS (Cro superfamily)